MKSITMNTIAVFYLIYFFNPATAFDVMKLFDDPAYVHESKYIQFLIVLIIKISFFTFVKIYIIAKNLWILDCSNFKMSKMPTLPVLKKPVFQFIFQRNELVTRPINESYSTTGKKTLMYYMVSNHSEWK